MEVDQALGAGGQPNQARPPTITLSWGSFTSFKAVCRHLHVQFELFSPDGTPIRAIAALTLVQVEKDARSGGGTPAAAQNPTTRADQRVRSHTVRDGDSLPLARLRVPGRPDPLARDRRRQRHRRPAAPRARPDGWRSRDDGGHAAHCSPAPRSASTASALDPAVQAQVLEVRVDQHLRLPDRASVRLADPRLELADSATFALGAAFEVLLGAPDGSVAGEPLRRPDRRARAGVHRERGDPRRARVRPLAGPAPHEAHRHLPGDELRRHRAGRRAAQRADGRDDRVGRAPSRSSSRATRPTGSCCGAWPTRSGARSASSRASCTSGPRRRRPPPTRRSSSSGARPCSTSGPA